MRVAFSPFFSCFYFLSYISISRWRVEKERFTRDLPRQDEGRQMEMESGRRRKKVDRSGEKLE